MAVGSAASVVTALRDPYTSANGGKRDTYGAIVTFTDGSVTHIGGYVFEAVREACEIADSRGTQIVTISTPRTIARDLQGDRVVFSSGADLPHTVFPEEDVLGRVGRLDAWYRRSASA